MPGVSNSTPLIYLDSVGDLDLLQILFGQVFVPEAVYEEVVIPGRGRPGEDAAHQRQLEIRLSSKSAGTIQGGKHRAVYH